MRKELILLCVLLCFSACSDQNLAGKATTNSFFADPIFQIAPQSLHFSLDSSQSYTPQSLTISTSDAIIYKHGYYIYPGQSWVQFSLNGDQEVGDWFVGSAFTTATILPPEIKQDTELYVILFSCDVNADTWDCYGEPGSSGAWQLAVVPISVDMLALCQPGQCELDGVCYDDGTPSPQHDLLCVGGSWLALPSTPEAPGTV